MAYESRESWRKLAAFEFYEPKDVRTLNQLIDRFVEMPRGSSFHCAYANAVLQLDM
jgi:hypothetical protein